MLPSQRDKNLQRAFSIKKNGYDGWVLAKTFVLDTETPVSLFLKLRDISPVGCLLESVEGGEFWARYSFIGVGFRWILRAKDRIVEIETPEGCGRGFEGEALDALKERVLDKRVYREGDLPPFFGGAIGYLGYDSVRRFERVPDLGKPRLDPFDAHFFFPRVLIAVDRFRYAFTLMAYADLNAFDLEAEVCRAHEAIERVEDLAFTRVAPPVRMDGFEGFKEKTFELTGSVSPDVYQTWILKAKAYIEAGDIIQVVPSRRFHTPFKADPFALYRVLRLLNPSPYMFYLQNGSETVVGSSPEVLVRVSAGRVLTRPIAGTRRRGRTQDEDIRLERELLGDTKERAEHLMLVDLARNDVGRVAGVGSVRVSQFMHVERYSHVMHIVSDVIGTLKNGLGPLDALRACFPAGTLTGAPKVRAMEIIEELEAHRRGIYGGCVGYIGFGGALDMGITIRTAWVRGDTAYFQAGGGIVADSDPASEEDEVKNKAMAMAQAIAIATNA